MKCIQLEEQSNLNAKNLFLEASKYIFTPNAVVCNVFQFGLGVKRSATNLAVK